MGFGVVAGSCGCFVMVTMYKEFPITLYLACSAIFFVFLVVNFLLVGLASIPNGNANKFVLTCKSRLKTQRQQTLLRLCTIIEFSIGFVGRVKYHTALNITDTVLNFSAGIVLLKYNV